MVKKKLFFICATIVIFIIIIFLVIFNYKKIKIGNNESNKSVNEVKEYILNINSYTAEIEVTVNSNKNTNKYILKQEYNVNNTNQQTVLKPENIEGTTISYKDGNLEIKNSQLNLSKIYSNYPYLSDNVLWLSSFISDYKEKSDDVKIYEEDYYIVMEINNSDSKYFATQKLYLEQGTGKPQKMIVQDDNKNDVIYILYTEIEIEN